MICDKGDGGKWVRIGNQILLPVSPKLHQIVFIGQFRSHEPMGIAIRNFPADRPGENGNRRHRPLQLTEDAVIVPEHPLRKIRLALSLDFNYSLSDSCTGRNISRTGWKET